jgi:hypothetical protein
VPARVLDRVEERKDLERQRLVARAAAEVGGDRTRELVLARP